SSSVSTVICCFFFQAEDGIRDKLVTGVQTCALPICCAEASFWLGFLYVRQNRGELAAQALRAARDSKECKSVEPTFYLGMQMLRSEERRVGKECRSGGWAED